MPAKFSNLYRYLESVAAGGCSIVVFLLVYILEIFFLLLWAERARKAWHKCLLWECSVGSVPWLPSGGLPQSASYLNSPLAEGPQFGSSESQSNTFSNISLSWWHQKVLKGIFPSTRWCMFWRTHQTPLRNAWEYIFVKFKVADRREVYLDMANKITLNNTVLHGGAGALCDITKGQGVQHLCTGTFDLPEISSCDWLWYFKMSNKTHCEEIQQQTPMPSPQRCIVTYFLTCKRPISTLICWWILMKTKYEKLGMIWDL